MGKLNDCFSQPAKMLTLNEALARFSENIVSVCKAEDVKLACAEGRIIFADVISSIDVPPHNNSAVDGFVVYHGDLNVSGSTTLPIRGRVVAGGTFIGKPERGQAIQIFTGAPIPQKTKVLSPDTIFMIEDVAVVGDKITLPEGQKKGANIRMAGEDVKKGDIVINYGKRLRPQDIGMLAAIGHSTVSVRAPLKVAIFSTGDEICDPGEKSHSAQIFDINRYSLMSLLKKLGCKVNDMGILPDDKDAIRESIRSASRNNDLLLTSGGVSMGEEDHVRTAINELGKLHFWKLLIKPGRPIALGHVNDEDREVPIIALPGNPVAVMVTFLRIARPLVLLLSGSVDIHPNYFSIPSAFSVTKKKGRREWLRVSLVRDKGNNLKVKKFPFDGSGILSSMVSSDGLVELSEDIVKVSEGDLVDFLPFSEVLN